MTHAKFEEDFGYTIQEVDELRKHFKSRRARKERMWKLIDAYDSGEFWDTLRTKLPQHQIIPDTNYVYYVKDNIVNSTFSAPYIADVLPIDGGSDKDDDELYEETRTLNKFIEFEYNRQELGHKQLQLGSRTALLNVSFLQCGWDNSESFTINDIKNKGQMEFIPRDAMAVLLDPNYEDFQEGRAVYILTEDSYENTIAKYPQAKDELLDDKDQKEEDKNKMQYINTSSQADVGKGYHTKGVTPMAEGMVAIFIAFKKTALEKGGYRVDQIIYTDNLVILETKKGIKPNYFPLVALYASPPERDGYGVGVVERILKNALSLNILDSIAVTHTYAAQRTPILLDTRSGLLPERIKKDLNMPDRIFPIHEGDVTKTVHRLDFPALPDNLQVIAERLEQSIARITGIDDKYTGRDTASVTTTGGMERLQSRATMTDNTRIQMIEKYARDLTRTILDFYVYYGGERSFVTNATYEENERKALEVDFTEYKGKYHDNITKFAYHIDASPLLPKNRQRLAESANMIMQVQMQYQGEIELLSPEEWLFFQDFPQKDMILDRMKLDRLRNDYEDISAEIASFGAMTEEGMRPEEAVKQLADERAASREPAVMRKQAQSKQ